MTQAVAVEHEKLGGGGVQCMWYTMLVSHSCPLAQSNVAVCFWYKVASCIAIGSEFEFLVVGLPCLKMLWNKYTTSCIHA